MSKPKDKPVYIAVHVRRGVIWQTAGGLTLRPMVRLAQRWFKNEEDDDVKVFRCVRRRVGGQARLVTAEVWPDSEAWRAQKG